jgi:spore germination cell wall hydrolase CwlJ-like protein
MVSSIKEIFMVKISFMLGCMLFSPVLFAKDVSNKLDNEVNCIVRTVLAEGENQSRNAKVGIMYTIKNRVKLSHKSYCSVVNAKNQFSHRIVKIIPRKHKQLVELAKLVMAGKISDVTNGATFFNDDSLSKNPFRHTVRTVKYDNMIFYKSILRA